MSDINDIVEYEEQITSFRGKYGFLSNFHECPIEYPYASGIYFKSSEHIYLAHKAKYKKDYEFIRNHPFEGLKESSRMIPLRDDWDDVKYEIMMEALLDKFTQNYNLWDKLVNTGDIPIIEGNSWHDNEWGDCMCDKCSKIEGQNKLGNL